MNKQNLKEEYERYATLWNKTIDALEDDCAPKDYSVVNIPICPKCDNYMRVSKEGQTWECDCE